MKRAIHLRASEQRQPAYSEILLNGGISIASGNLQPRHSVWHSEALNQGLKVVIVESGELLCRFPRQQELRISGPAICAVWNQDDAEASQCFLPGSDLRYTAVTLSLETLSSQLPAAVTEQLAAGMQIDLAARPRLQVQRAPLSLQGLQAQLLACPMQGMARQLYLTGKALEIVAHSIDAMLTPPLLVKRAEPRLTATDVARLHEVKQLLSTRLNAPPSLQELSLSVGMNTRKLTVGFRRLFGETIYGYLQTLRLETAYRLLAAGEINVSSVAYQIGYTPAHLSVAFRKRYGFAPKNLRS